MKLILTFATLLLLLATYLHPITAINQDLGRHIKTGKIIWNTQAVPKTNLYSYTYPDFPFINHHWGSEVIFYALYTNFGISSTLVVTMLSSVIAFGLLYFFVYKKSDPLAVALVSFLSFGILFERTDVRPESFSFLFTALFLFILFKNREKPTRWLALLIPLQLLWVNMHVYFIIGIVLLGLFFLDALIKKSSQLPLLFFVLVSSCLVTLFNPNELSGALYPFRVFENYGYSIEENQNIFFLWEYAQKKTIAFFWVSVILLFGTLSLRAKYTRPIDWLLAITFTILGIQAIRNFPLYVFAVFIPFTYHLSAITPPIHKRQKVFLSLITCLLVFFAWQISYAVTTKPLGFSTPTGASKAVDFLIAKNLKGPFFNNFDIGSYLIFRLYPIEKVFVDGRPEAYPASFFQQLYIPMQQDPKLFKKMDKKYHFKTIFFAHTDQTPWAKQFLKDMVKNPDWKIVYLDHTIIIATKKTSPLPALSLASFSPASGSVQELYQLLLFFQMIDDPQNMLKTAQEILKKDPNNCVSLSLFAQTTPIYQTRYVATCQ